MQFSVHVFFIALPVIFCFISLSLKLASTQQQLIMTVNSVNCKLYSMCCD